MAIPALSRSFKGIDLQGLTVKETICEYMADRMDANGSLIDVSGENLLAYSQDFTQGSWGKNYCTIGTLVAAPNGTVTASPILETAGTHEFGVQQAFTPIAGQYTLSVFVKPITRSWLRMLLWKSGEGKYAWFNLASGVVGANLNSEAWIIPLSNGWFRCVMTGTISDPSGSWYSFIEPQTANMGDQYEGVASQEAIQIWGAQLNTCDDAYQRGPGVYVPTTSVPNLKYPLTPASAATKSPWSLINAQGEQLNALVFNGTGNYYSRAHDANFSFAAAHTIVALLQVDSSATQKTLFQHASGPNDGLVIYVASGGTVVKASYKGAAGAHVEVDSPTIPLGCPFVYQLVRIGNASTAYVNGVAGTPGDVTNLGLDASATVYFGGAAGDYFKGSVAYFRFDKRSHSYATRTREVERLFGLSSSHDSGINSDALFTRSTQGYVTLPDRSMALVSNGMPRIHSMKSQNLLKQSNAFSTSPWSSSHASIAATSVTLPDGSSGTVNMIHEDATNNSRSIFLPRTAVYAASGKVYTFSVYAKASNRSWLKLLMYSTQSEAFAYFDLTNGVVGSYSWFAGSMTPVGNGWYRCSISGQHSSKTYDGMEIDFLPCSGNNGDVYQGTDQDSIAICWAQFEEALPSSAYPSPYVATTTEWVDRKKSAVRIETNMTNLLRNSNESNLLTAMLGISLVGSAATSPDGNWNGTKVVEDGATSGHYGYGSKDGSYVSGNSYTTSAFFRYLSGGRQYAAILDGATGNCAVFDIRNGVLKSKHSSYVNYGIEPYTNRWYRCWASWTSDGTIHADIFASHSGTAWTIAGLSGDAFLIWGIQTEPGLHPTSLIKTLTSAVSRGEEILKYNVATLLPSLISGSTGQKKLGMKFVARHLFKTNVDINSNCQLLELGGNTGTATMTRNRLLTFTHPNNNFYFMLRSDDVVDQSMSTTLKWDMSQWHTFQFLFDLSNLANSTASIDGVSLSNGMSGAKVFDLANVLLRIGGTYADQATGDAEFSDVYVWAE
jgi:hypothetical protein